MKKFILLVLILNVVNSFAQFDIEKYKEYLNSHKNMTYEELLNEYPAGVFLDSSPTDIRNSDYGKEIIEKFKLTDYEISLINKNGFMVSDRLRFPTFINALWDVYIQDMPVYISSDAILQALHFSYDKILTDLELRFLVPKLDSALYKMKKEIARINLKGKPDKYVQAVHDIDLFISVARKLLNGSAEPSFKENISKMEYIDTLIKSETFIEEALFSDTYKGYDFSQFTPRGHYAYIKDLTPYFQTMMWLGRIELIVSNAKNEIKYNQTDADLQRMALMTSLLAETAQSSTAIQEFTEIESILKVMIGKPDNISIFEVIETLNNTKLNTLAICDTLNWRKFQSQLMQLSSANQLYNSQVLFTSPMEPELIPPSVFLLFGQRPIIDGFITANVVYDKIVKNGAKVKRMIPSTLDILFSLGNDAAIQLMSDEINKYTYAQNLAGLRYLVESYNDDFWQSTLYTNWLNGIRSLNPPENRKSLPKFMQTAAWWQKTMNTQLAGWSQLRYNFLLYAKQPYTSSIVCSYPYGYIEPIPDFYNSIKQFWMKLDEIAEIIRSKNSYLSNGLKAFSKMWIETLDKLELLSNKILNNIEYDDKDMDFICSTLDKGSVCDPYNSKPFGWYLKLYYGMSPELFLLYYIEGSGLESDKMIVTDVHTIPTDEDGNMVGWVLHGGTGPINMAVITAPTHDGKTRSYIGPVFSYYEFISNDFKRLTNEEWRDMKENLPYRPKFSNLYMANADGNKPIGEVQSLKTVPTSVETEIKIINEINIICSPNPFKNKTAINFEIPKNLSGLESEINIYDMEGKIIKNLFKGEFDNKVYSIIWDGLDNENKDVISGSYLITIRIGDKLFTSKVVYSK